MNWMIENWYTVIGLIAVGAVGMYAGIRFLKKPSEEQLTQVREWLLYGVSKAEAELGQGTGALKLRYVYDLFTGRFPVLSMIITFTQFSALVDESLDKLEGLLSSNEEIKELLGQEEKTSTDQEKEEDTQEESEDK